MAELTDGLPEEGINFFPGYDVAVENIGGYPHTRCLYGTEWCSVCVETGPEQQRTPLVLF